MIPVAKPVGLPLTNGANKQNAAAATQSATMGRHDQAITVSAKRSNSHNVVMAAAAIGMTN